MNMAIGAVGVIILLSTGLNSWLRNLLQPLGWQPIAGWFPWQVLVYFLILVLGYEVLSALNARLPASRHGAAQVAVASA